MSAFARKRYIITVVVISRLNNCHNVLYCASYMKTSHRNSTIYSDFWMLLHTEGFTTAWEDSSFGRVFATKAWGYVSHPCFHEDMSPIPASVLKGRPDGMDAFVTLHPGGRDDRMNSWASLTSQTSWVSMLQIREILSQEVRWGMEWALTSQSKCCYCRSRFHSQNPNSDLQLSVTLFFSGYLEPFWFPQARACMCSTYIQIDTYA